MAPTLQELNDLFWRVVWTAISTFTGALMADDAINAVFGDGTVNMGALETALVPTAGAVVNIITVFARQKLPNTGINVPDAGDSRK